MRAPDVILADYERVQFAQVVSVGAAWPPVLAVSRPMPPLSRTLDRNQHSKQTN